MTTKSDDLNLFEDVVDGFFKEYGADETMRALGSWMSAICACQGEKTAIIEISSSVMHSTVRVDVHQKENSLDRFDLLSRLSPSIN